MGKIILVPIERIEQRYSVQWWDWLEAAMTELGREFICVGDYAMREIKAGQFLDIAETNTYKFSQLQEIINMIQNGEDIDTIFFMDYWFPGVQALAYIRDNMGIDFKIKGMLHAGTYDDTDFITQNGCGVWGNDFERSLLKIADQVIVGSQIHRQTLINKLGEHCKITVRPYPVYDCAEYVGQVQKENIVVFPHRLGWDKQPYLFEALERMYNEMYGGRGLKTVKFVRTLDHKLSKDEYYKLLAKSKVVFSAALHELFGLAMLEGVNCGCYPVAPNRLAYRETLAEYPLYENLGQAVRLTHEVIMGARRPLPGRYNQGMMMDIAKEVINQ